MSYCVEFNMQLCLRCRSSTFFFVVRFNGPVSATPAAWPSGGFRGERVTGGVSAGAAVPIPAAMMGGGGRCSGPWRSFWLRTDGVAAGGALVYFCSGPTASCWDSTRCSAHQGDPNPRSGAPLLPDARRRTLFGLRPAGTRW